MIRKLILISALSYILLPGSLAAQAQVKHDSILNVYINLWEEALLAKNKTDMIALLDSGYKVEQLDGMYKGDQQLFFDQLFCGDRLDQVKFECLTLKKIDGVKMDEIKVVRGDYWVYFIVSSGKTKIRVWSMFLPSEKDGRKIYGYRGPVG